MTERVARHDITALFEHPSAAQDAATALTNAGFDQGRVTVQPGASEEVLRFERNQDPDVIHRGFGPADNGGAAGFVLGFLGGGLLGLIMGSGALNIMGKEPAMAVGPFWSAAIGAVVLGLAGAFCGYVFNSPLPQPEPPLAEGPRRASPTIVSVTTSAEEADLAVEALERSGPASLAVWSADNGDWTPLATN